MGICRFEELERSRKESRIAPFSWQGFCAFNCGTLGRSSRRFIFPLLCTSMPRKGGGSLFLFHLVPDLPAFVHCKLWGVLSPQPTPKCTKGLITVTLTFAPNPVWRLVDPHPSSRMQADAGTTGSLLLRAITNRASLAGFLAPSSP